MKLVLLTVLFPLFCFAQKEKAALPPTKDGIEQTSFLIKDRKISYQKVFDSPFTKEELINKMSAFLSGIKSFKFDPERYTTDDEFFGHLFQYRYDLQRFNTSVFNTPLILRYPLNGTVVVQVKDHKYRVTITDLVFRDYARNPGDEEVNFPIEYALLAKGKNELNKKKTYLKAISFLEADFSSMFDMNNSVTTGDF